MDHREIGNKLNLFFFDDISPGSCFFRPKGAIIYNGLVSFLRFYYKKLKYQEVITPNLYNKKLWETSGHWAKYKKNMFMIDDENEGHEKWSLKPMNCPGHCIIFKNGVVSYRELPIKYADFGVLHRNELSGALSGLTRVRRFQQDDAHIFCALNQIEDEINKCLLFQEIVYKHFQFEFSVELSTRPKEYIGSIETWNKAEAILKKSIKQFTKWTINEGDGAFYGPKIDIKIKDNRKREHQCGTLQLDFNLPERFDLKYKDNDDSFKRPVIIHRAILGSVERFIAILLEHGNGKLPFWLSPRQVSIVPIDNKYLPYANEIAKHLENYNIFIDDTTNTLNKKIRNSDKLRFNYVFVVGEKEVNDKTITIRANGKHFGTFSIDNTVSLLAKDLNKKYELL